MSLPRRTVSGYRCGISGVHRMGSGIGTVTFGVCMLTRIGPEGVSTVSEAAVHSPCGTTVTVIASSDGRRISFSMRRAGTTSIQTVPTIPENGVYHMPPGFSFCFP